MKKLLTVALVGATTLMAVQTATAGASTSAGPLVPAQHGRALAAVTDANPLVKKKKKGWKYKSFQATSCWLGGRPFSQKPNVFFGSPNGFRCAVAYVTVSGVVAYNGDTEVSPTSHNTQIAWGFADALIPRILPSEGPADRQRAGDALMHGKARLAGYVG